MTRRRRARQRYNDPVDEKKRADVAWELMKAEAERTRLPTDRVRIVAVAVALMAGLCLLFWLIP
jgi:hypothetical protein